MISLLGCDCPYCGARPTLQKLAAEYIDGVPGLTIRSLCSHGKNQFLVGHRDAFIRFAAESGYIAADIAEYLNRDTSTINYSLRKTKPPLCSLSKSSVN